MSEYMVMAVSGENINNGAVTVQGPYDYDRGLDGSLLDKYDDRMSSSPVWDDLRVSANTVKVQGASNIPAWGAFGTLQALWFDPSTMEQVFIDVQLPHARLAGTDIHPHVHWTPKTDGSTGDKVSWGLEYTWTNVGDEFPATTTIYGDSHYPAEDLAASGHYVTSLENIGGAGKGTSSMLICRLFRDATGAGGTDDYADDVGLLEFDFHYQINKLGSTNEYPNDY